MPKSIHVNVTGHTDFLTSHCVNIDAILLTSTEEGSLLSLSALNLSLISSEERFWISCLKSSSIFKLFTSSNSLEIWVWICSTVLKDLHRQGWPGLTWASYKELASSMPVKWIQCHISLLPYCTLPLSIVKSIMPFQLGSIYKLFTWWIVGAGRIEQWLERRPSLWSI